MGIKTDIDTNNKIIGIGDAIIIDGQGSIINNNRYAVSSMSLHNPAGGTDIIVRLFRTADNTSAGGVEVAAHSIRPGQSIDITEIIGQGYIAGTSIVALADSAGTNVDSTVTIYEDI